MTVNLYLRDLANEEVVGEQLLEGEWCGRKAEEEASEFY